MLLVGSIERSLRLVAGTSHTLVAAAFLAELASELCYAELLGRSVGVFSWRRNSGRTRARPGRWFMLRLTVTGYGAAHVLPGGGAAAATVTYDALRRGVYDLMGLRVVLGAGGEFSVEGDLDASVVRYTQEVAEFAERLAEADERTRDAPLYEVERELERVRAFMESAPARTPTAPSRRGAPDGHPRRASP